MRSNWTANRAGAAPAPLPARRRFRRPSLRGGGRPPRPTIALIALLAVSTLAILSCFDSAVVVKVNKDGSGTVEETVVLSTAFTELMAAFGGMGEEADEQDPVDEDRLKEKAKAMGPGVELLSAEAVTTAGGSGFKAVYRFRDINTLRINQNPSDNVPSPTPGAEQAENPEELLQFRFAGGPTATLEILYPQEPEGPGAEEPEADTSGEEEESEDPQMMAMMRELYRDMRMKLVVEVAGTVVDTNAAYREGSRITLMEVDFGKLMDEGDSFDRLMRAKPETVEAMKEALEGVEAIKVETARSIRIRFR